MHDAVARSDFKSAEAILLEAQRLAEAQPAMEAQAGNAPLYQARRVSPVSPAPVRCSLTSWCPLSNLLMHGSLPLYLNGGCQSSKYFALI
jgi:hypothetical protein